MVVRPVEETEAAVSEFVTARFVEVAFVAVRLVLETLPETIEVEVTVPTFKPNQRKEDDPRLYVRSVDGRMSELTVPERVRKLPLFTMVLARVERPRTARLPVVVVSPRRLILKTSPVEVVVPLRR